MESAQERQWAVNDIAAGVADQISERFGLDRDLVTDTLEPTLTILIVETIRDIEEEAAQ